MIYCPKCASENTDEIKFCRVCGTNLELVSLVLAGRPLPDTADDKPTEISKWLAAQRAGTRQLVQGIILLAVSAKIGFISYLVVSGPEVPWFLFWAVFFGWLAGWGAISLALGSSKLIEAKLALRQLRSEPQTANASIVAANHYEPARLSSVTEHTTRQLSEPPAIAGALPIATEISKRK